MQILRHYQDIPKDLQGGVVVLGNFDGLHRGHQTVIGNAAEIARAANIPLLVMSFEPHPISFLKPDQAPFRLTPLRVKAHQIEALDVDGLVILAFDHKLSSMMAEDFVRDVLNDGLKARHVVVGYDFCFGKGRVGTPDMMRDIGHFDVTAISPISSPDQQVYSSSNVRDHLKKGKPGHAAALLGRPFEIEGRVEHGDQRGRTIGFPTANVSLGEYLRPLNGVYAVRVGIEETNGQTIWQDGVANLGTRPTVDGKTEKLEVHIFNFNQDIYGKHMRVALIEFIRPEQKFDSIDALKNRIEEDSIIAQRILHTRAAGAI
jgi:riboflavin kinase/FMN adenylyltransferase